MVVRSQLGESISPGPSESSSAPPVLSTPPPPPLPTPTTTASAVDPGKLNRPLKPAFSAKPWVKPKGGGVPAKKPADGTIEIPDVPGDVPPAP
jgi:hypothetical protein